MPERFEFPPALNRLSAGIQAFRLLNYQREPNPMRDLVEQGQSPEVLMIACSDSRVDPAMITNAAPGELFVVRNVANLVPPYNPTGKLLGTSAAIEFAVRDLNVGHVIVMGHARCGGIQALIRSQGGDRPDRDFLGDWVDLAQHACDHYVHTPAVGIPDPDAVTDPLERAALVERAAVLSSLANLRTFPWLREREEAGTLCLWGWWFDLSTGALWSTRQEDGAFAPVFE